MNDQQDWPIKSTEAILRDALRDLVAEQTEALKSWQEWWAKGAKGFHQWPMGALNRARQVLVDTEPLDAEELDPGAPWNIAGVDR